MGMDLHEVARLLDDYAIRCRQIASEAEKSDMKMKAEYVAIWRGQEAKALVQVSAIKAEIAASSVLVPRDGGSMTSDAAKAAAYDVVAGQRDEAVRLLADLRDRIMAASVANWGVDSVEPVSGKPGSKERIEWLYGNDRFALARIEEALATLLEADILASSGDLKLSD